MKLSSIVFSKKSNPPDEKAIRTKKKLRSEYLLFTFWLSNEIKDPKNREYAKA